MLLGHLSVLLCSPLSFLRDYFVFCMGQISDLHFFEVGYWKIIVSLWLYHVSLIVSSLLFKFSVAVFTFGEAAASCSLCGLTSGESCLPPLLGILRLSQACSTDASAPRLWFPFEHESSRLYTFSPSCKCRLGADRLQCAFPRTMLKAHDCALFYSPAELVGLASCMHSLTVCKGSYLLPSGVSSGSWPEGGVCVVEVAEHWGCLQTSW